MYLIVPIKGAQGKATLAVLRGYSSNPAAYKNYVLGSVRRQVAFDGNGMEPGLPKRLGRCGPAAAGS